MQTHRKPGLALPMDDTRGFGQGDWLVAPIPVLTTSLPCTHTVGDGSLAWSLLGVLSQVV